MNKEIPKKTIDDVKVLFNCIIGSHCYGLNTETSDIDYKKIYKADEEQLFSLPQFYQPQINITKDDVAYEVGRFLELIQNGNPTCIELLFVDDKFIISTSPEFEYIKQHRDSFITKRLVKAYAGYAAEQLVKAQGKEKHINWDKERIKRKTPIDFCFIEHNGKSYPLQKYLDDNNIKQEECGLVGLSHMKDVFALYKSNGLPYRGICLENGNSVRVSSIPKGETPIGVVYFNLDGYSMHCKDYNKYMEFQKNKNEIRYATNKKHGQSFDSKNISHLKRLSDMGLELSEGKGLNLIRPNREEILSIKRGEIDLREIIKQSQEQKKLMFLNLQESNLPEELDINFVNNLLLEIRKMK